MKAILLFEVEDADAYFKEMAEALNPFRSRKIDEALIEEMVEAMVVILIKHAPSLPVDLAKKLRHAIDQRVHAGHARSSREEAALSAKPKDDRVEDSKPYAQGFAAFVGWEQEGATLKALPFNPWRHSSNPVEHFQYCEGWHAARRQSWGVVK